MSDNENKWLLEGRTGYVLMHHGWNKGEELFRNQFSFGLSYDYATVTEKEAEEKAAFIVRAVNSHDALVAALKTAQQGLNQVGVQDHLVDYSFNDRALSETRAALVEAEKP